MMLEIDGWKVGIKFSAAHFIPGHYKCSHLHGHDYGIRVHIYGEPKNCYLYDFVNLKKELREIAEEMDHKLLLPRNQDYIKHKVEGDIVHIEFDDKHYMVPLGDIYFLDTKLATAEELARYVGERVAKKIKFPPNVKGFEIAVDEGLGQGAWYYIPLE